MGYEVNVAFDGRHLFATHERSIHTEYDLKRCLKIFMKKFPESEGYHVSVEYWQKTGKNIDINSILKEE